jgi:hypothetical protein
MLVANTGAAAERSGRRSASRVEPRPPRKAMMAATPPCPVVRRVTPTEGNTMLVSPVARPKYPIERPRRFDGASSASRMMQTTMAAPVPKPRTAAAVSIRTAGAAGSR